MTTQAEQDWFRIAASERAPYHGTLLVATAHQALLRGRSIPRECFQHRGEAIRIINERLDDPLKRSDDITIGTVACLAAFEVDHPDLLPLVFN